jgi:hypothetical protein
MDHGLVTATKEILVILEAILFVSLFHHKPKPKTQPLTCPDGQVTVLSQGGRACSAPQDSPEMLDDKAFVVHTEDVLIPLFLKDEKHAYWERAEIATVQADCAMAHAAKTEKDFYAASDKLITDVGILVVLDDMLMNDIYI